MSVLNKKPYAQKVVESLGQEELQDLVVAINGGGNTLFKSFINLSYPFSEDDKGAHHCVFEAKDNIFTGYLCYSDTYCVLFAYNGDKNQEMKIVKIDYANDKYEIIDEQLSIDEFRQIIYETSDTAGKREFDGDVSIDGDLEVGNTAKFYGNVIIPIATNDNNPLRKDQFNQFKSDLEDGTEVVAKATGDGSGNTIKTFYGHSIEIISDSTNFQYTFQLKDGNGTVLNQKIIDLPIESVVVSGTYDSANQKIVLTLQNGSTIDVPVGALISGLQTEITSQNKLASDLVDDTNQSNKFVSATEKSTWNGKADGVITVETWNTATKTLALSDANKLFKCSHTTDQTLTIPTNATVSFPIGTMISFLLTSTYTVTFVGATGVDLMSIDSLVELATQYGMASLIKIDTNTWQLVGALE